MANTRIETFIGFCVKAGKITLGSGAIDTVRRGVFVLIVSADAAKNTQKLALKYKNRFDCPLIVCKSGLERAVNKPGCKIASVRYKNLADSILESLDDNYEYYDGGKN